VDDALQSQLCSEVLYVNLNQLILFLLKPYHVDDVVQALLADHNMLSDGMRKYIRQYRVDLNHRDSAWTKLQMEKNLYVLTGLLYDWLEHLRVPILGKDDLTYIVILGNQPAACLKKLDLVSCHFITS
jgi:protein tyrosine phosphatase domain-containing protein 1